MPESHESLARTCTRAVGIASAGTHPAVRALAPRVTAACGAYLTAHEDARTADAAKAKETREADAAIVALAREYDAARNVVRSAAPDEAVGPASTACATGDDQLRYAEDVERILEARAAEGWSADLLAHYRPFVETAAREWTEAVTAKLEQQKVLAARRDAAARAEAVLVEFRRVVRVVYGSTSREYHSITPTRSGPGGGEGTTDGGGGEGGGTP